MSVISDLDPISLHGMLVRCQTGNAAALVELTCFPSWKQGQIAEMLCEAQLTIYHHPERIDDLAGERGKPALDAAAKLGSATAIPRRS